MEQDEIITRAAMMRELSLAERNALIAAGRPSVVDGRHRFREPVRLYKGEDDCA